MRAERGNALFLILIAVALFAALSYAVTQSSRGGGAGVDSEKASLLAAEIVQQATAYKTQITRMYTLDRVDQVRFDSSAYNISGTVYLPDASTMTGRTQGLYDPSLGFSQLFPPETAHKDGSPVPNAWAWTLKSNIQAQIGFVDIGTSGGDEILHTNFGLLAGGLSQEVCAAINEELTGSPTIPVVGKGGAASRHSIRTNRDGTVGESTTASQIWTFDMLPGCHENGTVPGNYGYFDIIKQN